MERMLVMTVIGRDQPGLVESVARLVAMHGGNWLESRMSRLGGQFAGILRVQVPAEKERLLVEALDQLDALRGLKVVVHPDTAGHDDKPARRSVLEVVGQDRPGIIRQITGALAERGINVEELHTECASAAMSGETLFKANAHLSVPASCNMSDLRRELEKIAEDLIVELSLVELSAEQSANAPAA